jgi:hypothetical protein
LCFSSRDRRHSYEVLSVCSREAMRNCLNEY